MTSAAVLVSSVLLSVAAPADTNVVELPMVQISADLWRFEEWRGYRTTHPEEAFSPQMLEILRTATAAQPFLFHWNPNGPHPAVITSLERAESFGLCIVGKELDSLVSNLLDPRNYLWGDTYGIAYVVQDDWLPRLGIEFRSDQGTAVLTMGREFITYWFDLPYQESPGAPVNPAILEHVAEESFPEECWSPGAEFGWYDQGYW